MIKDLDDTQITSSEHSELAYVERVVHYLQGDVDYHKKMLWSSETALKNEEASLKKLQTQYSEGIKQRRLNHENH